MIPAAGATHATCRTLCAVLLFGLGVVVSRPVSSEAPERRIGYVNVHRLQTSVRMYGEGLDLMAQRSSGIDYRMAVEGSWRFLTAKEAARAVELELTEAGLGSEELTELRALRTKNGELELERLRLKEKAHPTEAETRRLMELQRIGDARQGEIGEARKRLEAEALESRRQVEAQNSERLATALHAVAQKHDLDLVLSSHVRTLSQRAEEGSNGLRWENVVLYGGLDVTDDVIATLNALQPPPAPSGGGDVGLR